MSAELLQQISEDVIETKGHAATALQLALAREHLTREGLELLVRRERRREAVTGLLESQPLRYAAGFAVGVLSLTLAAAWAGLLPDDFVGLVGAIRGGHDCPVGVPPALVPVQPAPSIPAPLPVPT